MIANIGQRGNTVFDFPPRQLNNNSVGMYSVHLFTDFMYVPEAASAMQ